MTWVHTSQDPLPWHDIGRQTQRSQNLQPGASYERDPGRTGPVAFVMERHRDARLCRGSWQEGMHSG